MSIKIAFKIVINFDVPKPISVDCTILVCNYMGQKKDFNDDQTF